MSAQPRVEAAVANGSASPSAVVSAAAATIMQNPQLSSELKSLVDTILSGGPAGSLEQLLQQAGAGRQPQIKPTIVPQTQHSAHHAPSIPTTPSGASVGWSSRKRAHPNFDPDEGSLKRRRSASYTTRMSGEKQHNKGLRHFSQRVCEKVREKKVTTYNEVADELVKELSETDRKAGPGGSQMPIDHKNIRRRVYDALNVLMAMNIISKEKKEIRWIGLPTNSVQECQHLEAELASTEERIQAKKAEVEDLLVQVLTFKNLMRRNRDRASSYLGAPGQNSAISLPFIIVSTNKKTTIDCSISSDKSEYVFNFDNNFELHQDIDVLKKMGLDCGIHSGTCTAEDLRQAKAVLPKAFEPILDEIVLSNNLPAASVLGTPNHSQGASPCVLSPNVTSTPTPSLTSPGTSLSPLIHPGQTSPLSHAQIAAAVAQVKQAAAALQSEAQGSSILGAGLGLPGKPSPVKIPSSVPVCLPSPSAASTGASNVLSGSPAQNFSSPSTSHAPSAKTQLHSHCPGQSNLSPLVKNMAAAIMPVASGATNQPAGSPQVVKSPATKVVTVSKLPVSAERLQQLNSLLHSLQQKNSSLLKQLPGISNGSASQVTTEDGPSVPTSAQAQTSLSSQLGIGLSHGAGSVPQPSLGTSSLL